MTINNENVKQTIKTALANKGFDLSKSNFTADFIDTLVDEVLNAVKNATVIVPATGLIAPSGAVTGQASGTIS